MNCPACEGHLEEITVKEITVDVCKGGCGGLWFDNYELDKVDEPHETLGEALLEYRQEEHTDVDHEKKRYCPKCDSTPLMRHFYSVKHEVEVDECPRCGVIVGKFLAALFFVVAILLPTLSYPIFISFLGQLDWGPVIGGYVGAIFLAAAYTAIGLFASSLTRNQIIAFIVGVIICFSLTLLNNMLFFFPQSI